MRRIGVALVVIILVGIMISSRVVSAAGTGGDAIRVSPAISNVQLESGQASTSVEALITNLTSEPLSVTLSGKDFGALNETGTVGFFGSSYNPATNPHSLQNSMNFPLNNVYLAPHASQKVTINLNGLDSLAAGGHFGAVLFTPESSLSGRGKTNVSIRSSVASLIFLITASGGTQSLQLLTFHVGGISFSLPATNYIGFHNSGNTQSAVNGQLTLYGPHGNIVSTTVVNPGSGLVLPGTSRVFPVTLPLSHARFALPGQYHLVLQYRDGTQHAFTTVNEHFFYINLEVIIPAILLLALLVYTCKRWGMSCLRMCRRIFRKVLRVFRKKRQPVVTPPPKKRRPPLIQG